VHDTDTPELSMNAVVARYNRRSGGDANVITADQGVQLGIETHPCNNRRSRFLKESRAPSARPFIAEGKAAGFMIPAACFLFKVARRPVPSVDLPSCLEIRGYIQRSGSYFILGA